MADIYPVDYTTDVGRVRKYIPDIVQMVDPADPGSDPTYMWADEDIQSFIDDQTEDSLYPTRRWHIYRAAADIMVATANNEALVLKKIVTEDLQTDGPAVAAALLKGAAQLYGRADELEETSGEGEIFISVPYYHTPPRYDWR